MDQKKIVCHDINNNLSEVGPEQLTWRPSIYGILIEGNKVLLSKQWDGYDFPGGGVNIDETLAEGLKREFFEETGLEIELISPVYCRTSFFHPTRSTKSQGQYWNAVMIYYLVKKVGGQISKDNCDAEEQKYLDLPEWIDVTQLKGLKFYNALSIPENFDLVHKALTL